MQKVQASDKQLKEGLRGLNAVQVDGKKVFLRATCRLFAHFPIGTFRVLEHSFQLRSTDLVLSISKVLCLLGNARPISTHCGQ